MNCGNIFHHHTNLKHNVLTGQHNPTASYIPERVKD